LSFGRNRLAHLQKPSFGLTLRVCRVKASRLRSPISMNHRVTALFTNIVTEHLVLIAQVQTTIRNDRMRPATARG